MIPMTNPSPIVKGILQSLRLMYSLFFMLATISPIAALRLDWMAGRGKLSSSPSTLRTACDRNSSVRVPWTRWESTHVVEFVDVEFESLDSWNEEGLDSVAHIPNILSSEGE